MKKNKTTLKLFSLLSLCSLLFALCSLSCEQPFKAGLGPIIDLQDPTIVLEYPAAGANIRDVTEFRGSAADDFKVDSVWFNLANYPDVELPPDDYMKFTKDGTVFYKITDTAGNDRNITWKFKIDTLYMIDTVDDDGVPVKVRAFPDGDFKLRLRVTDGAGKEVVTDEIVFYIKNDPPLITVTAPSMQQGTEKGYLGGNHLNYDFELPYKRAMDTNGLIIGSISDHTGINRLDDPAYHMVDQDGVPQFDNQGNPVTTKLFPPQMRFWQVYFDTWPVDKYGVPVPEGTAYPVGYYPNETEVRWMNLGEGKSTLMEIGAKDMQFTYKLSDESGSFYAFQVRAQSKDIIHSTAEYPRDYVNYDNIPANITGQLKEQNLYVLILVREPMENPELKLYEFEDIFGEPKDGKPRRAKDDSGESNKMVMLYNDLLDPKDRNRIEGNHIYVNETSVNKKGPFTLRVKASHSGGIASATVYWEKNDRSKKGRFIWDPVDRPYPSWKGIIPSKAAHYSTWGLNEPDGVTEVRSFVFTYSDENGKDDTALTAEHDRLPNTTEFTSNVMGNIGRMSKIQEYKKTAPQINPEDGKPYKFDELPDGLANWTDVYKLDEGTYNVYIYATSNSGTPVKEPLYVTISIDRQGPKIDLNYIEGRAGDEVKIGEERVNTVNGVIRPIFQISDSRPVDAGFREENISEYFRKNPLVTPAIYYLEQAYVLILESDTVKMEAELAKTKNLWPFPNEVPITLQPNIAAPVIEGVSIKKHGPLDDSSTCLIKTSYIYNNGDDKGKDDLPDGNYRLYAFARDGAFNVSYRSFPIIVDRKTDFPTIELTGSSFTTGVTKPDSAYDFGGSKYNEEPESSFIIKDGNPRNMFSSNTSSIPLRIRDDDSLYMGPDDLPDQPGINVTLIGTKPDKTGGVPELKLYGSDFLIEFDGDAIKQAFNPLQTIEDGKRTAVLESRGSISHRMLADLVKNNPKYVGEGLYAFVGSSDLSSVTTLPDGIYRLGISVSDDRDAKLKMPTDPAKADAVTVNINNTVEAPEKGVMSLPYNNPIEYFWIAVDNSKPQIELTSDFSGIILPGKPEELAGKVFDENGPITLVGWEVKDGNKVVSHMGMTDAQLKDLPRMAVKLANGSFVTLNNSTNNLTYIDYINGKWEYTFSYWMDLYGASRGAYNFEVTFRDRFNKQVTVSPKATADSVPPTVTFFKPIETFSRTMLEDSEITKYTHIPANIGANKERLSVKTVNFGIDADDSNGVAGVRWWLLPADTGAGANSFDASGIVSGYDAFPAKLPTFNIEGVYYGNTAHPNGFNKGVYGVMKVPNASDPAARYIVAFDSRKLVSPNGEYRLHIIATDTAGNQSVYLDTSINVTNVVQVVFFLQEQDKPYFDKNISPGEVVTSLGWPQENGSDKVMPVLGRNPIIDGTIWDNNGFFKDQAGTSLAWPGSVTVWLSGEATPLTAGWEDKVKDGDDIAGYTKVIIPDSALGKQERNINLAIELTSLFPTQFTSDADGRKRYIIKATDSPVNKLREQLYTPTGGSYDPIEGNAIKMGGPSTGTGTSDPFTKDPDTNDSIREFSYKQYAFVYDGMPPTVVIDTPLDKPKVETYGRTSFADPVNGFVLGGYISDANLATLKYYYENLPPGHPDLAGKTFDSNGKYTGADKDDYYFEYYLNTDTRKLFVLKLRDNVTLTTATASPPPLLSPETVDGKHIYAITKDGNKITVYFRISVNDVTNNTNGLIPLSRFNGTGAYAGKGLPEGQNTFNVWASDVSGKEGAAWVNFVKDIEPPIITFSNLTSPTGKNNSYNAVEAKDRNESIVDKISAGSVVGWWSKTADQRQALLLVNNPPTAPRPLPLTTIYYDTGIPVLRGNITDFVSNIKLETGPMPSVGTGEINIPNSAFKYWIDNAPLNDANARYYAVIDGKGSKSVRWTINLTKDGTTSPGTNGDNILYDGVHTIVLTAADEANEEVPGPGDPYGRPDERYMVAFRIDHKPPRSAVTATGIDTDNKNIVYGNKAYQNTGSTSMFTLDLTGDDANLEKVELNIKNTTTGKAEAPITFTAGSTPAGSTGEWKYYPFNTALTITPPLPASLPPPVSPLEEDYVLFRGRYPVPKDLFSDDGKYDVRVAAYDTWGNKSEEFLLQFTYDKTPPVIEFTNPSNDYIIKDGNTTTLKPENFIDTANPSTDHVGNINRLVSENLRIQGNVKDTFSPVSEVQSRVEKWNWLTGTWGEVEEWKPIKDFSTNQQLQVSWQKYLLGQDTADTGGTGLDLRRNPDGSIPAPGTANTVDNLAAAEGLYRIKVRARDASAATTSTNNGFTNDWDTAANPGVGAVNGKGNPVFSDYEYFYFDRTAPKLEITSINGSTTSMDTYYSNPGKFTFKGTVTDNNRFAKVEVKFEVTGKDPITNNATLSKYVFTPTPEKPTDPDSNASDPAPDKSVGVNVGGKKQNWEIEFAGAGSYPDGKYKVTVTAYDMTGRSSSETKSFILDSTPPTVKFTLPAKVQSKGFGNDGENKKPDDSAVTANGFASQIVPGGPTSVITGETGDKPGADGEPGSESGIDQMWFHLGFIDGATYNDATNQFPNKAAIKAWESTLIERHTGLSAAAVAALTVKQRNAYMDTIAEYRASGDGDNKGNAWFKLGGIHKPTGFIINNPNIYDWRFEIPDKMDASMMPTGDNLLDYTASGITATTQTEGLKLYTGPITVKGRRYTVGSGSLQMVRAITGQAGGVYRLPLWVRLTDVAGNVEYYCHDIWIDANGSIPSTSIESPSNGTQYNARGGTISVDGVARSNTSVYDVIFRVFADARPDTNLDGIQTNGRPTSRNKLIDGTPNVADIVRITGYDPAESTTVNLLPAVYRPGAGETWTWQRANLTLKGGSGEPIIPWSIMLNSEDQIKNLISSKGFNSANPANSTPTNRDMIRVWMEVFVFNGEGAPVRSSVYPNDNLGTGNGLAYDNISPGPLYGTADPPGATTPTNAKPYVRAFYIRTGAAAITHPNVGTWTADYKAPTPPPNPAHLPRANFTWNGEDSQKQGGGGYGGAGTETRSNKFAISATLDPNPSGTSGSGLGEVAYRIKLDDGSYGTWTTVWKANTPVNPANPDGPKIQPESIDSNGVRISLRNDPPSGGNRIRYYFDYAINSKVTGNSTDTGAAGTTNFAPVNGGNWATTGGTVTIQIRMKDNSPQPNEAEQTIQVGVDNFAPLTDINYRTNPKVAGSNVNFMGRVYDYATTPPMNTDYTPRKLERVSVWFTRGGPTGPYVNLNQKNTTAATLTGMRTINVYQNRQAAIGGGGVNDAVSSITLSTTSPGTVTNNFSYPGLGTQQPYNADYVRDITQATGQPQYKMLWSPVNAAVYDVRWQLTLDSTLLPDGELTLHYIVVDAAGNASYYTQTGISVRNNYPEITSVTLYTDNNGKGAQYTMDDTGVYPLNDYRSKMFANYTDPSDNQIPSGGAFRKTDTTGYLNSGFISKNSYLGFKVETNGGNRPLTFRLQHVKRQRLELTAATLNQMITDRTAASPTTINLYTIAWHGNYTPQKWRALGVPIDNNPNPTLGTHFVFNPVNISDPNQPFNVADAVGTAEVWKYTTAPAVTIADITNQGTAGSDDTVVYGPANNFRFNGATHFNSTASPAQNTPVTQIGEYDGSHPTAGDAKADNPNTTAFFLIRVWDSINSSTGEMGVNDKLYDAVVIGANVYLTDKNDPVARLYDLNPYTEAAVIENNKNQTIKDAANPTAVGSNIVRGGLYNDGSSSKMVRSGFIDPRNGSTTLNPKNGVYFRDQSLAATAPSQLVSGLDWPDYPLRVAGDAATGTTPNPERDKVSGRIILRGFAWDDQLIDEITLTLPNAPTSRTILKLNDTTGKMAATTGYTDTAFVVEELHWKTGHSVEWAYIWDTGTDPATNQTIRVTVKDKNGGRSSAAIPSDVTAPATALAFHNQAIVDIVPYITGFERKTPDFSTKRSLQGWYSFFRGEQGIKVNGYNFGTTAATITIGGANMTNTGAATATQRTFNIPDSTTVNSGEILMTTSVAAYNNTSSTTGKSWNKEANSYTPGSDLWINHHYAHIWRSNAEAGNGSISNAGAGTYFAAAGTSEGLDSPGMSLQYTGTYAGRLHGVWTNYSRETVFYAQNHNVKGSASGVEVTQNVATHTVSTRGESTFGQPGSLLLLKCGEPYSAGDIDYYNPAGSSPNEYTNNVSVSAAWQRDGEPMLVISPRLSSIVFNNANSQDGGGHHRGYFISRQNSPTSTYRWKNTRIKKVAPSTADNNPGKVFVTAYDSTYKRLFFKTVSGNLDWNNSDSQTNDDNGGTALYLDGGGALSGLSYGSIGAATGGAGEWAAVDTTTNGNPVVAYFDAQHQTLRLAYAGNTTPAAGNWTVRYVIPSASPLYLGSGSYVSMKIDHNNRIHLAFYNSTYKAVVYATAASPSGDFTASVIDRVVEGGQWTDIAVDRSGNPWIVYADSSRIGNPDGARIAYRSYGNSYAAAAEPIEATGAAPVGAFGRDLKDPISGKSIKGWEAITMPASYNVKEDRLNIESWPPSGGAAGLAADCPIGSWNAAVGYGSDLFRIGYFFKPASSGVMRN